MPNNPPLKPIFHVYTNPPKEGLVYYGTYAPLERTNEPGTYRTGLATTYGGGANYLVHIPGAVEGNPQAESSRDRKKMFADGYVGVYAPPGTRERYIYSPLETEPKRLAVNSM